MGSYDDIINLEHHRSQNHPPMPMESRAAQFAPFAALSGHDEAIMESGRLTDSYIEISNDEKIEIGHRAAVALTKGKRVTLRYFVPDKTKQGGSYATSSGIITKIDESDRLIYLDTSSIIPIDHIVALTFG